MVILVAGQQRSADIERDTVKSIDIMNLLSSKCGYNCQIKTICYCDLFVTMIFLCTHASPQLFYFSILMNCRHILKLETVLVISASIRTGLAKTRPLGNNGQYG